VVFIARTAMLLSHTRGGRDKEMGAVLFYTTVPIVF
jgi:hypothetical protein